MNSCLGEGEAATKQEPQQSVTQALANQSRAACGRHELITTFVNQSTHRPHVSHGATLESAILRAPRATSLSSSRAAAFHEFIASVVAVHPVAELQQQQPKLGIVWRASQRPLGPMTQAVDVYQPRCQRRRPCWRAADTDDADGRRHRLDPAPTFNGHGTMNRAWCARTTVIRNKELM